MLIILFFFIVIISLVKLESHFQYLKESKKTTTSNLDKFYLKEYKIRKADELLLLMFPFFEKEKFENNKQVNIRKKIMLLIYIWWTLFVLLIIVLLTKIN